MYEYFIIFIDKLIYNRCYISKDECQARYRQLVELVKKKQHIQ